MGLFEQFQQLAPAVSTNEYAAIPIDGRPTNFLAKSAESAPVFLLHDASKPQYTPGTILKNLSVHYHATCRVQSPIGDIDGQFAVISCDASVPELFELFIRCVDAAIEQLPNPAETQDIEASVRLLLNLFRSMNAPGGREIAGLWAELFVITQANDIKAAVEAWHADTFERFDFSWPNRVLEVKATQGAFRIHEFALEQLATPSSGSGLVASLLLQQQTNGIGIIDLANEIDNALKNEHKLRQRLWENIATALGSEFSNKLDRRFDLSFAERNVAIFNMADIPAPEHPSDSRITGIRFKSDLTTVTSSVAQPSLRVLRNLL